MQFNNPFTKHAILGAALGAIRAENLTKEQRNALKKEYDLDDDASLTARNALRGFVGSQAGSFAGGLAATGIINRFPRIGHPAIAIGLPVTGSILGAVSMTNRYSEDKANRILRRQRKRSSIQ